MFSLLNHPERVGKPIHRGETKKQLKKKKKKLHHYHKEILNKSKDAFLASCVSTKQNACTLPCLPKIIKEIQNKNMSIVLE